MAEYGIVILGIGWGIGGILWGGSNLLNIYWKWHSAEKPSSQQKIILDKTSEAIIKELELDDRTSGRLDKLVKLYVELLDKQ